MNLYEITRELVARGCPEHPRLRHEHSDFCAWSLPYPIATIADPESARCGVSLEDARDLWNAHARAWFLGRNFGKSKDGEYWGGGLGGEYGLVVNLDRKKGQPFKHWRVSGMWPVPTAVYGCEIFYGHGDTELEAIESATRHLAT